MMPNVPADVKGQAVARRAVCAALQSGVSCRIVEVSPAAAPGTVYRVVPSTAVQLKSASSTAEQSATAAASTTPADSTVSGSSGSRPNSGRPTSAKTAGGSSGGSSSKNKSSSKSSASTGTKSSSKSGSKSKSSKREDPDSPEVAATASGSMFDLLDALGDD